MNPLLPLIAAILQAGSFTLDKFVLSMRSVSYKTYNGISLPLSALIMLALFLIVQPPLLPSIFTSDIVWLIAISIVISVVTNILFYRALDDDSLSEMQTIELLQTFPILFLSGVVFSDERNLFIIIPALFASTTLFWSHWESKKFNLAPNTWPFFVWSLTAIPAGALIAKTLLTVWNPISFELVRWSVVALVTSILFYKEALAIRGRAFYFLVLTNILSTVGMVLFYYSYQRSGIIYTLLLFSLQPFLVYLAACLLFKEKIHWKKSVAFLIVLISIIIAQITGNN